MIPILITAVQFLSAQSYESIFGTHSTQWNITIGNLWGQGTDEHVISGDTLISGKEYKIVDGYSISGFIGFLREDTLQGKAWYKNNQDTIEYLIMDLGLNVGDSMYIGGNWNPQPGFYKVDSIYFLNNRKHIRFVFELFFSDNEPFTLIEGITSNMGFRYQDNCYINNFNPKLLCSYKNGTQIYGTGQCINSGIYEIENEINLEVFPNPFSDGLNLKTTINEKNKYSYKIINLYGRLILEGEFPANINNSIDLSRLDTGIYLIVISNENNLIVGKKKIIKAVNNVYKK